MNMEEEFEFLMKLSNELSPIIENHLEGKEIKEMVVPLCHFFSVFILSTIDGLTNEKITIENLINYINEHCHKLLEIRFEKENDYYIH